MRVLIVYESMFGNTAEIAAAIARGLREYGDVTSAGVADPCPELADIDLLVAGGPVHAFGLSRARTRQSAAEQAGSDIRTGTDTGIREWLRRATAATSGSRR